MANEFVVKNGLIVSGSTRVQGSVTATSFTGSFSGSIAFATSASYAVTASYALNAAESVWTASASNIYYNSGNVGIGTTNPSTLLHLSSTAPQLAFTATGLSRTSYIGMADGANFYIKNTTAGNLYISDYNEVYIAYGGSSGNVGIGTSSVGAKLEINSNAALPIIRARYNGTYYTDYDSNGIDFRGSGQTFDIKDNGTVAIRVASGGNVGIGTTSPNEKLHVAGNIHAYAAGGIDAGLFASTSGGSTTIAIRSNGITHFNGGNVGIGTTNPIYKLHVVGSTYVNSGTLYLDSGQWAFWGNSAQGIRGINDTSLDFLAGNAVRMIVLADGNVGIGTTGPVAKLTVLAASTGYSSDSQIKISDTTTSYYGGLSFDDAGSTRLSIRNSYDGTGSTIGFGFGGSADKVQIIDGTGLIVNEGNVGIGTTNPQAKLQVSGSTNVLNVRGSGSVTTSSIFSVDGNNGRLFEVSDDLSNSLFSVNTIAGLPVIEAFADYSVTMGTYGQYVLQVTGSNVGIGSSAPGAKLDVNGNVRATSFTGSISGSATNAVSASYALTASYALNAGDSIWTGSAGNIYYNGGNVGIGITNPSQKLVVIGNTAISGVTYTDFVQTYSGASIDFRHQDASVVMRVDTTNARVGIGTTGPETKLHVSGGPVTLKGGGATDQQIIYNFAREYVNGIYNSSGHFRLQDNSLGGTVYQWDGSTFAFPNGNIGIGTTGPSAKLHVVGESKVTGAAAAYTFFDQANGTYYSVWYRNNNITYLYDSYLNSNPFVINASGNIGIGTTSPGAKLEVVTPSGGSTVLLGRAVGNSSIKSLADNGGYLALDSTGGELILNHYSSANMWLVTGGGNVGIATTNPTQRLQVDGALKLTSNPSVTADGTAAYFWNQSGVGPTIGGLKFQIQTNGATPAMTIDDSQRVGIGTTSPAKKLDVQVAGGDGIRVSNSTNPAYYTDLLLNYNDVSTLQLTLQGTPILQAGSTDATKLLSRTNQNILITPDGTGNVLINNGKAGIGSTEPQRKLDSYTAGGAALGNNYVRFGVGAAGAYGGNNHLEFSYNDYGNLGGRAFDNILAKIEGNTDVVTPTDVGGILVFSTKARGGTYLTAPLERMRITHAGSVGVGTTNPTATLEVIGNVKATSFTGSFSGSITNAVSASYALTASYALNAGDSIWTGSAGNIYYNGGNVGIGTTTPDAIFHVAKATSSGVGGQIVIDNPASSAVGNTAEISFLTDAGASGAGTRNARILAVNQDAGNGAANMQFHTWNGSTSAEKMRITPGGSLLLGDTVTPDETGWFGTAVLGKNGTNKVILGYLGSATSGATVGAHNSALNSWADLNITGTTIIFRNSSQAETARITNGGNVGIGTTNPTAKLHVVGSTYTVGTIGIQGTNVFYFDDYGGGWYMQDSTWIRTYNAKSIWTGGGYVGTDGGLTAGYGGTLPPSGGAIIAGSVGIGVSSPAAKLHIAGGDAWLNTVSAIQGMQFGYSGPSHGSYRAAIMGGPESYGVSDSGMLTFHTQNGYVVSSTPPERMRISSGGNVGIGTTSPGDKLDIAGGSIKLANGYKLYDGSANDSTGLYWDSNQVNISGYSGIIFRSSNTNTSSQTERMRITSGGNVGIGTTSPNQKLQINSPLQTEYYGTDNSSPGDTMNLVGTGALRGLGTGSALLFSVPANTDGTNTWAQARILGTGDNASNGNAEGAMFLQTRALYNPGTGGSWNWRTNMVLRASGNVGIGTSNPSQKLQVNGSIALNTATNGSSRYYTYPDANHSWYYDDDIVGSSAEVMTYYQNFLIRYQDTTNVFLINSSGNVGIGTTNPSSLLTVAGTTSNKLTLTGGSTQNGLTLDAVSGYGNTFYLFNGNGGLGNGFGIYNITTSTLPFYIANNNATTFSSTVTATNYYASNGGFFGWGDSSTRIDGDSSNQYIRAVINNSEKLRIDPSGNVGIGTTSPSYKLDIDGGSATTVARFYNSGTTSTIIQLGDTGNSQYSEFIWNADTSVASIFKAGTAFSGYGGANSLNIYNQTGPIAFHPNNISNAMTIASSGNVGIGTTSPAAKLDIVGDAVIRNGYNMVIGDTIANPVASTSKAALTLRKFTSGNASTVVSASYYLGVGGNEYTIGSYRLIGFGYAETSATTTYPAYIGYQEKSTSGYTLGDLIFGTRATTGASDDPSERMRITSGGNVGIGSTSPAAKLDIVGTSSTFGISFGNTVPNNPLFINTYGGWSGIGMDQTTAGLRLAGDYSSGASPLVDIGYYSSATVGHATWVNRFRVLNNGNVGIGITNPARMLDINGTTNFRDATYFANGGVGYITWGTINSNNALNLQAASGYFLNFGTNATTGQMVIDTSGNVGIGSAAPAFKLDVNGNAAIGTKLSVGTTYNGFTANIAGTTYIIGASAWVNDGYGYANASSPTTGVFPTSGNDVDINTLGSTSLKVKVGGFVGIGTTNPLLPLDVVGTVRATTFIETSARKYKTNIQNLEPQLNKVLQLQPVTFDWKEKKGERPSIGLIADDVINIYPEFVVKNKENEIEGIDYSKLTAVLIQSVKELKEIIDRQQEQINALLTK